MPKVVYHDLPQTFLKLKKKLPMLALYYSLWQRSARHVIAELQASRGFDLMHHVTFAGYRYPVATAAHKVPSIWGPIGGVQSVPRSLLPWQHPRSLAHEFLRN